MIGRLALVVGALACAVAGASAQTSHVVVITGVAGEPKYSQQFHEWANKLADAAVSKHGVAAANVVYLSEKPELGGRASGKSTKDNVEQALTALASKSKEGDAVLIVLIGHGSAEGGEPRFNLSGPDLTAKDYHRLLEPLNGRRVALVNAASASGAFLESLSQPGRTIITATRSGMERNETIFGKFFADAFAGASSDTDKDGKVSLLEAYTYTAKEVERWYREQNRLITEHAQLDDNGDAKGTALPDGKAVGDGNVAKSFLLASAANSNASPALRALLEQKRQIEEKIENLRTLKSKMEAAAYEKELEKLLIELSLKNQEIKKLEGGSK